MLLSLKNDRFTQEFHDYSFRKIQLVLELLWIIIMFFKCCISIFPHRQWCSFRPSPIKNGIYLQTPFCQFVRHFLLAFIAFFPFRVYAKDVLLLQLNCHLITKQSFFFKENLNKLLATF